MHGEEPSFQSSPTVLLASECPLSLAERTLLAVSNHYSPEAWLPMCIIAPLTGYVGDYMGGGITGVLKWNTRRLDYGSYGGLLLPNPYRTENFLRSFKPKP